MKTVSMLALLPLAACANGYSAKKVDAPYYVFRGYHLECVKVAQERGGFKGSVDPDLGHQTAAYVLAGVPGIVFYNVTKRNAANNPTYRQCMADYGMTPRD